MKRYYQNEAAWYAKQNPSTYPLLIVDEDDNELYYIVGIKRMQKIFEATEEAMLLKLLHNGSSI